MKKIKLIAAVLVVAICSSFLFSCSLFGGGYEFDKVEDQKTQLTTATKIALDADTEYVTSVSSPSATYLVFEKDADGIQTYGIYNAVANEWTVPTGTYTDYTASNLSQGRLVGTKTVDGVEKYGVYDLINQIEIVPFTYTLPERTERYSISGGGNYSVERIRTIDENGIITETKMNFINLIEGTVTPLTDFDKFEEGKSQLGVNKSSLVSILGANSTRIDAKYLNYSYAETGNDELTIYNEKGAKTGSFSLNNGAWSSRASIVVGTKFIEQFTMPVDMYSNDYDYIDALNNKYDIKTQIIDLSNGNIKNVKLDYLIESSSMGVVEGTKNNYVKFEAYKIDNKRVELTSYYYIANDSLGNIVQTIGEIDNGAVFTLKNGNIFDIANNVLYKKNFDLLADFSDYTITGINDKNIVLYDSSKGDSYLTDLNGKLVKEFQNKRVSGFYDTNLMAVTTNEEGTVTTYSSINVDGADLGALFVTTDGEATSPNYVEQFSGNVLYYSTDGTNTIIKVKNYANVEVVNFTYEGLTAPTVRAGADVSIVIGSAKDIWVFA